MAYQILCSNCGASFDASKNPNTRRFCSRNCSDTRRCGLPEERFWQSVNRGGDDDCWEWFKHTTNGGYGHLGIKKKLVMAHRFSWELHNGPIPDGMNVLHRCDNPPCCNPNHLWLGSLLENNRDRAAKGRSRDQRGAANNVAVLTKEAVLEIRRLRGEGLYMREIADKFGVHRVTVHDVLHGRSWMHV